ncbi:MAG: amidohydrolase [Deltaproteobacteria bacterium]|nr:amidohydrolase [Deltaproteobacteria bacterium]
MASTRDLPPDEPAMAFTGGRVLTMDAARPSAEVVVTAGGRIVAVGERALLDAYPRARRVDLGGRLLVPGFIDAHNHLSIAALHPLWADLSGVKDQDGLRDALAEQAGREPGAAWIRGCNWDEASGLTVDRADLDALGFDRPVLVAHYTLHQAAVSSAGLDALGIGRDTPDPHGGHVVRAPDGTPTGILVERAWSQAQARSMMAYHDPARWEELYRARALALARDGITCVHDAACSPSAESVYRRLATSGRLPISVLMMPHGEALLSRLDPKRLDGAPTGEGDEWLRVGAVKLFADGGAAPAIDVHLAGGRIELGLVMPGLDEDVRLLVERGFGVAVHAIGNVGLGNALEAFRVARGLRGGADLRLRVEHAMLASPAQMAELRALDLIGVVQPGFVDHVGTAVAGVEFDDAAWLPFGGLARAGVRLAASSDDPCAFHEPLLTSARGATRRCGTGAIVGPEHAIAYEEWLRAYTAGAAYAGGQEHERGRLAPGLRADLVVLDGALDPEHPPTVDETWVAGERVYAAASAA